MAGASSAAAHSPAVTERQSHHLLELEGLRALAAIAVLLTHAGFLSGATGGQILPGFLARMDIGVAIFFVLSGFLLYRPHARHLVEGTPPAGNRSYALRRTARLVPAWLMVLAGTLVLVPESRSAHPTVWVTNLLQLQSLRLEWDLPGLAQLWSLSTEVMFYIALPFLAVIVLRVAPRLGPNGHIWALLGLAAGSWGFRALVGLGALPDGWSWTRTLPAVGDWFVVGMLMSAVLASEELRRPVSILVRAVPWHLYGVAACVFWVVTTRAAGPYDLAPPTTSESAVKHLGYTVVAALIVAPSVLGARTPVSRILSSRVLVYLGTISYGIFLWHLPIMFRVREVLGLDVFAHGFWVTVVVTFAFSALVSAASWHLLEAPVQSWARRRTTSVATGANATEGGQRQDREREGT
ncbi:MAG: acyltransferase [Ornithinibacter sp.]